MKQSQFFLYDGLSAGAQVGPTLSFSNAVRVEVTDVAGRLVRVLKPGSIHTQKIVRVDVGK